MAKGKIKKVHKLKRTHSLENEKFGLHSQIADIQEEIILRNNEVTKLQKEVENINTLVKQDKIKQINLNDNKADTVALKKTSTEMLIKEMRASDMTHASKKGPKKTTPKTKLTTPDVSPENKAFLKFVVASGGYENGWSKNDHNEFLRIRAKLIVESEMVEALLELLPEKTEEEIIAHEKWYQKYLDMREKHKTAIQNWRKNRNKSAEVEKKKVLNTVRKPNKPPAIVSKSSPVVSAKVKARIEKWKKRIFEQPLGIDEDQFIKGNHKLEPIEKEEQKTLKEKRKKTKEMQAREKQRQVKEMIQAWKATKVQAEEAEKAEKELKRTKEQMAKAARANKLIRRFQDQDEEIIRRKMQRRVGRPLSAFSMRKLAPTT